MANEKRILDSAYLDELKEWKRKLDDFGESDQAYAVGEVISDLEEMPTVDAVEVVHGRWKKSCVPDIYQCTNCKRPTKMDELCDSEILRAYCPNCGADMR